MIEHEIIKRLQFTCSSPKGDFIQTFASGLAGSSVKQSWSLQQQQMGVCLQPFVYTWKIERKSRKLEFYKNHVPFLPKVLK